MIGADDFAHLVRHAVTEGMTDAMIVEMTVGTTDVTIAEMTAGTTDATTAEMTAGVIDIIYMGAAKAAPIVVLSPEIKTVKSG